MLTYQDWLLFCFVLGVLGGTATALAFGGPVVQGCILGAAGTAGAAHRGLPWLGPRYLGGVGGALQRVFRKRGQGGSVGGEHGGALSVGCRRLEDG